MIGIENVPVQVEPVKGRSRTPSENIPFLILLAYRPTMGPKYGCVGSERSSV